MTSSSELHVVFGTGPVGTALIEILVAQCKQVRVVTRSGTRKQLPAPVEVVRGDATDPVDTRKVCIDATHVYNCTNPVDYHRWPEQFPPLQRGILAGAVAVGAKLIVMENLYMYGPHNGVPMTENMPLRGNGPRSTTRLRMAQELMQAHARGEVRAVAVRASDLYGPGVRESLVGERLFRPVLAEKTVRLLANPDLPHSLTYISDVGRAMVTLGDRDEALGRAWHVPSASAVTLREFVDIVAEEAGTKPRISAVPRWVAGLLLPLMGVVVPPMRGLRENLYQFYEPYVVDSLAYASAFDDESTTLCEGVRATVHSYREPAPAADIN
jgi:nucleoside-diphosphate-sugar epimerase